MRTAVACLAVLLATRVAAADAVDKPVLAFVTASATSSVPGHEAWFALRQNTDGRPSWCGTAGVGDAVTFSFAEPIALARVDFAVENTPDNDARAGVAIPTKATVKTDAQEVAVAVDPTWTNVALAGTAVRTVTIRVDAVTPGKRSSRVCLDSISFDGPKDTPDIHPVVGIDRAAYAALVTTATRLDAAFRVCDPAGLSAAVKFPIVYDSATPPPGEGVPPAPPKRITYRTADELVAACRKPGSWIGRGIGGADDDATVAHDLAEPAIVAPGVIRLGDWTTHLWLMTSTAGAWQLTGIKTVANPQDDRHRMLPAVLGWQLDAFGGNPTMTTPGSTIALVPGGATGPGLIAINELWKAVPELRARSHRAPTEIAVALARDQRSGVLTFTLPLASGAVWRGAEVMVSSDGWRVQTGLWAASRKAGAPAGTLAPVATTDAVDDPTLRAAFTALLAGPIDAAAASRKDLVLIGPAANERTLGGPAVARAWIAKWATHLTLTSGVIARLTPSGTTGWILADATRDGVPVRMLVVFDKTLDVGWSLLAAQLATP